MKMRRSASSEVRCANFSEPRLALDGERNADYASRGLMRINMVVEIKIGRSERGGKGDV